MQKLLVLTLMFSKQQLMVQKFRATFFYLRNGVIIWMWMELRFTKIQHWPRCERRAHSISCQLLVERKRCFERLWALGVSETPWIADSFDCSKGSWSLPTRLPRPQHLAEPPSEEEQLLHQLAHVPFKDWCPACVAHRFTARSTDA